MGKSANQEACTLRAKLYKIILPTLVVLMMSIILGFNYKTYSQIHSEFESYKHTLLAQQSEALANMTWSLENQNVGKLLKTFVTGQDVVGAYISVSGGKLLASSGVPYHVATQYDLMTKNFNFHTTQGKVIPAQLKIAFSSLPIQKSFTERVVFEVAMVLLAILIIVLSILLFNRVNIEAPLNKLLEAFQAGQGDPKALVEWDQKDEIGSVIESYNKMRKKEWEQSNALMHAKNSLEQRVKERTLDLEKAYEELSLASKAKDEFLATMSHEIRTPMNGILGLTELLKDSNLSENSRQFADMIHSSSETLLTIINDILDLSKLESGHYSCNKQPFELLPCFQEAVSLIEAQAQKKGLSCRISIDDDLDKTVISDPQRIKQVLVNLLSNAVKFTEEGQVLVKVLKEQEKGQSIIKIKVIDSGIGIGANDIDKLFKKFSQVDSSLARKYGGSGLGLAICKKLVEVLGGQIGVESTLGHGSIFWFSIPLERLKDQDQLLSQEQKLAVPKTALRILVAEDNIVNQMVIKGLLTKVGYNPDIVESGEQVLAALQTNVYDVILMDIQLPEMDGVATTKAIRLLCDNEAKHTPIIALTANAMVGHRETYLAQGMDEYVSKPIDRFALLNAIARVTTQGSSLH